MSVTTFGSSKGHHISINGVVYGPFPVGSDLVRIAHDHKIYLHRFTPKNIAIPNVNSDTYYTLWEDENVSEQ
jgi:hypothetical protein